MWTEGIAEIQVTPQGIAPEILTIQPIPEATTEVTILTTGQVALPRTEAIQPIRDRDLPTEVQTHIPDHQAAVAAAVICRDLPEEVPEAALQEEEAEGSLKPKS